MNETLQCTGSTVCSSQLEEGEEGMWEGSVENVF